MVYLDFSEEIKRYALRGSGFVIFFRLGPLNFFAIETIRNGRTTFYFDI